MGDTVNLAARLMAAAGPGELLASPSVLDRSAPNQTRALEPFSVKGKSEPVHAFALGAETATRPESRSGAFRSADATPSSPSLRRRRSDARDQSRVIVITGDTGIGKSRLVTKALARMERRATP